MRLRNFLLPDVPTYSMTSEIAIGQNLIAFLETGRKLAHKVLFLHGFMGCADDWQAVMSTQSAEFDCLAVDLPGHGKTRIVEGETPYAVEECAALLIAFLHKKKIARCSLVGYSMGGRLALFLALRYPHYFNALILESASPGLRTANQRAQRRMEDAERAATLSSGKYEDFLNAWFQLPLFAGMIQHPDFSALLARRLQNDPQKLAISLQKMGTGQQPSLWPELPALAVPTLLLVGARDAKFIKINEEMAQACPKAQLQIIDNAGHNVHFERPAAYIEKIHHFLNRSKENHDEHDQLD